MKSLSITLFVLGIVWAYLCLGFLLGPIFAFGSETFLENSVGTMILWYSLCVLLCLLAVVGYWIWLGWLKFFRKGVYPGGSRRRFWSISLIHHILWFILIPLFQASDDNNLSFNIIESWHVGFTAMRSMGPIYFVVFVWLAINLLISGVQVSLKDSKISSS